MSFRLTFLAACTILTPFKKYTSEVYMIDLPPIEIHQSYEEQYLKAFELATFFCEELQNALLDDNLPDELYIPIRNLFIKLSWYGTILTAPEKLDELAIDIQEWINSEDEEESDDYPEEDWSFMLQRAPKDIEWNELLQAAKELMQVVLDLEEIPGEEILKE